MDKMMHLIADAWEKEKVFIDLLKPIRDLLKFSHYLLAPQMSKRRLN